MSLIDYPGKVASVIFVAGCNMCCHYCHNYHILNSNQNLLSFDIVLAELKNNCGWIDAVVVSGGEPTVYPHLIPLLKVLKRAGFLVKLDTNGTKPLIVQRVVELGLVDFVALDVKAPFDKYPLITGMSGYQVVSTINFLKRQKRVLCQFRTTVSPLLDLNDLIMIAKSLLEGAKNWQIQQCRCDGAYSAKDIQKMVIALKRYIPHIVVVGV